MTATLPPPPAPTLPKPPVARPDVKGPSLPLLAGVVLAVAVTGFGFGRLGQGTRAVDSTPPATAYVPVVKTGTFEDQRRLQAEAAMQHFVEVWLRPGTEPERRAALEPMVDPGWLRQAANPVTSLPSGVVCCPPTMLSVTSDGALYITRLTTGETVYVHGRFTSRGQFLVTEVS